jgi:hypothetical protein
MGTDQAGFNPPAGNSCRMPVSFQVPSRRFPAHWVQSSAATTDAMVTKNSELKTAIIFMIAVDSER